MIDFRDFENYLEARRTRKFFVQRHALLTDKDISDLKRLSKSFTFREVFLCFEAKSVDVKVQCKECAFSFVSAFEKKELQAYLESGVFVCQKCVHKNPDTELATKLYIESYLTPQKGWNPSLKTSQRIQHLLVTYPIYWDYVRTHILKMPYRDFLATPYWKAISEHKKRQCHFKCQLCGGREKLQTHHRSYAIHGDEIHHLKDLTVICEACHQVHHGRNKLTCS